MNIYTEAYAAPWKVWNELIAILCTPITYVWWKVTGISLGKACRFYGIPRVQRYKGSTLSIGSNSILRSAPYSNPLGINHAVILSTRSSTAALEIGRNFGMSGGSIVSEKSVKIGNYVLIGANCIIVDSDFHPLHHSQRLVAGKPQVEPVCIEDNVFIGMNSMILKGVHIGKGSVVGAGSVVTKDIPPGVIAAGNPAKVIKSLD